MRRDEDIERRLLEWARWKEMQRGGGLGSYARANLLEPRAAGGYREVPIPTSWVEAGVTDEGVQALDRDLRAAVTAWYLREYAAAGVTSAARAAASLGCSESTMHRRVAMAHQALRVWLSERAATKREQRAAVEAVLSAARQRVSPGGVLRLKEKG